MSGGLDRPERPEGSGMPGSPRRFVATAALAALVAAAALPGERLGLGVLLVAFALAVVAAPRVRGRWERGCGVLALLLAAAPVVRDAAWVVLPSLAAAVVLGSLAVTGGRTWAGVAQGALAVLARTPWGLTVAGRAARAAAPAARPGRLVPALRGAALAGVLVAVFGALFASADRAFAQLASDTLPTSWDAGPLTGRALTFAAVLAFAAALVAVPRATAELGPPRARLGATEWTVGLAALTALFAAFVAVQLAVLFGRHEHVLQTAGLTYAEYAHEGFGQLLLVAALVLALAAAALRYGPGAPAHRALLAALFALTFVILASALHRLDLYEEAYGATRLRLAAQWAILVVGALLAVVLAALATNRFARLPQAAVLTAALALLGLVAANPDRLIAERNLDRLDRTGQIDAGYVRSLSADARGALPPELAPPNPSPDGWSGFSLAR